MLKLILVLVLFCFTSYAFPNAKENCIEFHIINFAPLGFKDQDGNIQGVHWEYLSEIEKLTGLCINKTLLPYARVWRSIENGNHDGGIVFKSDSRSNLVEYVGLIRTSKTVVIPLKGVKLSNFNDLSTLIVGKTRGAHLSKKFDNDKDLNVLELNNYDQAVKMIKRRRIDAIAGSELVLAYQLNMHGAWDDIDIENMLVLGEKEQWLQLSKKSKHTDKITVLKNAITTLQENGILESIMNKYYGQGDTL